MDDAFLLGTAVLLAWAAVAVHAYRRAAGRRERMDLPGPDGGALGLLWLAPAAIVGSALLWGLGGRAADPASVLDRYVGDWRHGRVGEAIDRFVAAPDGAAVAAAWARQSAALRGELVRLAAESPPGSGIDPDRPLDAVRWVEAGSLPGGGRLINLEVARRESVRGELFGLLPLTSQRLVPIARLGRAELRPVRRPLPLPGVPAVEEWRLVRVEIVGIGLGR